MKALIFAVEGALDAALLDLAGRPLLVRQLQWLRELGIEDVLLELVDGAHAVEVAELALGSDPLFARCTVIPTRAPLGIEGLVARAGLREDELFCALPGNMVVEAALTLPTEALTLRLPTFDAGSVELAFRSLVREAAAVEHPGWAARVDGPLAAHTLSCAALAGRLRGLLVHAAEIKPGIWYARGARVAEDAVLTAPLLIGAEARVFAEARIGPNAIVGAGAVIEREAVLSEVSVAPGTLVGEGTRLRQAYVDAAGFTSFADASRTEVRDRLVLDEVAARKSDLFARLSAVALLLVLGLTWCVVSLFAYLLGRRALRVRRDRGVYLHEGALAVPLLDLVPALYDVVRGRRDLIGIADADLLRAEAGERARVLPGAFDILPALAPVDPQIAGNLVSWYALNKSGALDRELLRRSFGRPAKKPIVQRS